MAAIRLVSGVWREIWREATPLLGGQARIINTGIRCGAGSLSRVQAYLILDSTAGNPVIDATMSIVNGRASVAISNSSIPADFATYTLDIMLLHSIQQANEGGAGIVHVIKGQAAESGDSERFTVVTNDVVKQGQPVRIGLVSHHAHLADASIYSKSTIVGLAGSDGNPGDAILVVVDEAEFPDWTAATGSPALAVGGTYYLAAAPGQMTLIAPNTPGQSLVIAGIAVSALKLVIKGTVPILL